jgi:hypothetical protein
LYHTAFNIFLEPPEKTIPFIGPCHLDFKTTTFDDKNTSFQPTIVVTYISAFLVLNGQFIMFSTDIFLCFEQSIKSLPAPPLALSKLDQPEESCQL